MRNRWVVAGTAAVIATTVVGCSGSPGVAPEGPRVISPAVQTTGARLATPPVPSPSSLSPSPKPRPYVTPHADTPDAGEDPGGGAPGRQPAGGYPQIVATATVDYRVVANGLTGEPRGTKQHRACNT